MCSIGVQVSCSILNSYTPSFQANFQNGSLLLFIARLRLGTERQLDFQPRAGQLQGRSSSRLSCGGLWAVRGPLGCAHVVRTPTPLAVVVVHAAKVQPHVVSLHVVPLVVVGKEGSDRAGGERRKVNRENTSARIAS
jgi:hypothetical protein